MFFCGDFLFPNQWSEGVGCRIVHRLFWANKLHHNTEGSLSSLDANEVNTPA